MEKIARYLQPLLTPYVNHILAGHKEVVFFSHNYLFKATSFKALNTPEIQDRLAVSTQTFSFQNGIGHTDEDFQNLVLKINKLAKTHQLIINIHNPTQGTLQDLTGVAMKKMNFNTDKIEIYKHMTQDILLFLETHFPHTIHTHFAHSEAGIIIENVLRQLDPETLEKTKKAAQIITLGSPRPVSCKHVKSAINVYSDEDYIIKPFAKLYSHLPEYCFKQIESSSNKTQKHLSVIDHAMDGQTYLGVIKSYLN
jgi:hypothetical protein